MRKGNGISGWLANPFLLYLTNVTFTWNTLFLVQPRSYLPLGFPCFPHANDISLGQRAVLAAIQMASISTRLACVVSYPGQMSDKVVVGV